MRTMISTWLYMECLHTPGTLPQLLRLLFQQPVEVTCLDHMVVTSGAKTPSIYLSIYLY